MAVKSSFYEGDANTGVALNPSVYSTQAAASATAAAASANAAATSAAASATSAAYAASFSTAGLLANPNTWASAQTFTVAPVFSNQSASRTALGLGTAATYDAGTNGTKVALTDGVNTWANAQTFTTAPVFADQSGSRTALNAPAVTSLRGYIDKLILSYTSTTTFTVSAGTAIDSTNAVLMTLSSALTKSTSAWAVGSGNGGLDTGSIGASTWYHVYEIMRPDTGVVDVLFSTSVSSPTMPANYTYFRRLGSIKTDGSSHFISFVQVGDEFIWSVPIAECSNTTVPTSATLLFLSSIPTGPKVWVRMRGILITPAANAGYMLLQCPDETSTAANSNPPGNCDVTGVANGQFGFDITARTDTSGHIRWSAGATGTTTAYLIVYGWIDPRGRNS